MQLAESLEEIKNMIHKLNTFLPMELNKRGKPHTVER
jgi:hypothetical protein